MSKIYFEMNDKEKQLHHIAEGLDYSLCVITEGLSGTGEYNISIDEVNTLQDEIGKNLCKAIKDVGVLLKAVEDEEVEKL